MVALSSTVWGGIITILMLIGPVGIVIVWWFLMNRRARDR